MVPWLKLVRTQNLIIIIGVQVVLQYVLIRPALLSSGLYPVLNTSLFIALSLATVLVAAGGYIINDIYDIGTDRINKPENQIISQKLSTREAWKGYALLLIIGFILAFSVAMLADKMQYLFIYPLVVCILAAYSIYFKAIGLAGNFIISFFCAFVPGLIFLAEFEKIEQLFQINYQMAWALQATIISYMIFGFLSTFIRELIKDLEDMEGDAKSHLKTLPLLVGPINTKVVISILMFLFIASMFYWLYISPDLGLSSWALLLFVLLILIPSILTFYLILIGYTKEQFHKISKYLKLIMVMGIMYLFII